MPEAYASSIDRLRELTGTARDPQGHAFAMIAEYLRRDGKLEEARAVVEEGIHANPDFVSGHVAAALILTELGDLEPAKAALKRVQALDAGNTRASELKQGLVIAEEQAAIEWARAQGAGPPVPVDDEVVTATLGELYLEQGAPEKAAKVAHQILATDPTHKAALALLAKVEGGVMEPAPLVEEPADVPADVLPEVPVDAPHEAMADVLPEVPTEAPEEVAAVADLGPIAVPVEELGPGPVPVASLAPDAVPVESLAPDPAPPTPAARPEVVPIAHLAPDPVAAEPKSAAPEHARPDEPGDTPEKAVGEAGLDDFMSWLDEN